MKNLIVLFLLIPSLLFAGGIQQKHKSVIAAMSVASVGGCNVGTTSGAVGDMIVAAFFAYESGSYTMVGNLDEISFFSTQLNSTQIAALWNSGTPLDISAESNLVSYYRLGESAVFNANTEWELPNYLKKDYFSNLSMTFDGVDDYVDCGQLSALSGATEFTVSGWFKQTDYGSDTR